MTDEKLWQTEPNSHWHTNRMPVCDLCGRESHTVVEYTVPGSTVAKRYCFSHGECHRKALELIFDLGPKIEHVITRMISFAENEGPHP